MLSDKEKQIIAKKTGKTLKKKKDFKQMLESKLNPEVAAKVWENARTRLAQMYAEYQDLPKGVRTHTDNFIFPAAAIYLSFKEIDSALAYQSMKDIMTEKSKQFGNMLSKCAAIPGFKSFFLGMWDSISHKMFGESAGFKNVFYPKKKGSFKMDITQCPYHKYLTELGCPELNGLFCDNDIYTYGNIPGLTFTRTQTIGHGSSICDFQMEMTKNIKNS